MHLSVPKGTQITVLGADGRAYPAAVQDLLGEQAVYDFHGDIHPIKVVEAAPENIYLTAATSGEMVGFGETHHVLTRKSSSVEYERKPIAEHTDAAFVRLPQRKVAALKGLYDAFDMDEKGLFMLAPGPLELGPMMRKASWSGCTVNRYKTELRIDIENNRPSCFATKHFVGAFEEDLYRTLESLIVSAVITVPGRFNSNYIKMVDLAGVIFEGFSPMNDVPLAPARKLERKADVYHILLDDPSTPIELAWFHG